MKGIDFQTLIWSTVSMVFETNILMTWCDINHVLHDFWKIAYGISTIFELDYALWVLNSNLSFDCILKFWSMQKFCYMFCSMHKSMFYKCRSYVLTMRSYNLSLACNLKLSIELNTAVRTIAPSYCKSRGRDLF